MKVTGEGITKFSLGRQSIYSVLWDLFDFLDLSSEYQTSLIVITQQNKQDRRIRDWLCPTQTWACQHHVCVWSGVKLTVYFSLVQWPGGTYGLPMPDTGCPSDGITDWKSGWTYHDTEDDNNENQRSNIFHMPGNFSAHGIQQKFCLKVGNNGNTGSEIWPEGKYCLYKKGEWPRTACTQLFNSECRDWYLEIFQSNVGNDWSIYQSLCRSVCLSVCLSQCPTVCLLDSFFCLFICLSGGWMVY